MKKLNCQTLGQLCEFMLDGEPVFLIRAQDVASVPALEAYIAESKKAKGQNLIRSDAQMQRFKMWQAQHHDYVRPAD